MKNTWVIILLFLSVKMVCAQEYTFHLYFEDSAGNKDTLLFGFDEEASFFIDTIFGEKNIIDNPIDTIFDVFFTDAASRGVIDNWDKCLEWIQNPTYVTKSQFISFDTDPYNWFEIGLLNNNWPLIISWEKEEIQNFISNTPDIYYSENLVMFGWLPPTDLVPRCNLNPWPEHYTFMIDTSTIVIPNNYVHHYECSLSEDSLGVIFIRFLYTNAAFDFTESKIELFYSVVSDAVFVDNCETGMRYRIKAFDLRGNIVLDRTLNNSCQSYSIDLAKLDSGVYCIQLFGVGATNIPYTSIKFIKP